MPVRNPAGRQAPPVRGRACTSARTWALASALVLVLLASGCATLHQLAALRKVDFSLDGVSGGTLAGVPIASAASYEDLGAADVARLAAALAQGRLPLEATVLVRASNPADNVQARLLRLDWTLVLDDRETVSGTVDREYVLPPGKPVTVPVSVNVDLLDFFDRQLRPLVGLALAAAGPGDPHRVRLEATPTVQTALGPIRYPEPIRIEYQVGG